MLNEMPSAFVQEEQYHQAMPASVRCFWIYRGVYYVNKELTYDFSRRCFFFFLFIFRKHVLCFSFLDSTIWFLRGDVMLTHSATEMLLFRSVTKCNGMKLSVSKSGSRPQSRYC